jgi:serine/threonine-protein kinase
MALQPGTQLGPYELLDLIGAGGMGEVYRARDPRLNRTVAVKVLPALFSADPHQRARLEREARMVAQLSHPNICTLHDIGAEDGTIYLVMEHLAGETLAHRLDRGPIPLPLLLDIGAQIAEGLAAAHRHGIVHRDLKPANVMLTPTGVKLLDFGLAKNRESVVVVAASSGAQTQLLPPTDRGTIVGTLPYMAPEQVQGADVDARTDLWAFGAMLYEMITGTRAFDSPSAAGLVGAILEREPPPMAAANPGTPPALVRLVTRCLRKSPDDRWESARDVADELRWIGTLPAAAPEPRSAATRWPALAMLVLAGVGFGAAITMLAGRPQQRAEPRGPVVRSVIELPADVPIAASSGPSNVGRPAIALSPDGTMLAYVGQHDREAQLYLRRLAEPDAVAIAGTGGAYNPFFSPDGQWIGFFAAGRLQKVSARGSDPVVISEVRNPLGAAWLDDGSILIADQEATVLTRVRSDGTGAAIEGWHGGSAGGAAWPQALPGGQHALARDRDGSALLVSLRTGEARVLVPNATGAMYAASGHLVFARAGVLMAAPFDLAALQLTATAVPLVPDVRIEPSSQAAQFAVSASGTLAYVRGGAGLARLAWVDRTGAIEPVAATPRAFGTFALSPDGRRLAAQVNGPGSDIWVLDFARAAFMRLTTDGVSRSPVWTPDGTRVTYYAARPTAPGMYWQPWDGSAPPERLLDAGTSGAWSPDGRSFMYSTSGSAGSVDLWVLRVSGRARTKEPFIATAFTEWGGAWSPDGQWVAYTSDESGRYEVYIRGAAGKGAKWQVSTDGGEEPRWSADGRELFFRNGRQWLASPVTSDGTAFVAGPPALMFEGPYINPPGPSYDVAGGGRRFLVLVPAEDEPSARQVHLVQQWFQELTTKAPAPGTR